MHRRGPLPLLGSYSDFAIGLLNLSSRWFWNQNLANRENSFREKPPGAFSLSDSKRYGETEREN